MVVPTYLDKIILLKKPKCVCLSKKNILAISHLGSINPTGVRKRQTHNIWLYIYVQMYTKWRLSSMGDDLRWKTTFNGKQHSMEDDIQWKTTFNGRGHSMEDDIQWKTIFNGRRPSMENDLQWKTTFNGRWPLIEDDLKRKEIFNEWRPSMKDDLRWKTTLNGRRAALKDDLQWKTTFDRRWPIRWASASIWIYTNLPTSYTSYLPIYLFTKIIKMGKMF